MIPKNLHFIYLRKDKNSFHFMMSHYLSMKSNIEILKPEKVYFWTNDAPYERNWFQLIMKEYIDLIEVVAVDMIPEYMGKKIYEVSHQADVLKAWIVRDYGGIYSDLDSIALNPFPEEFYELEVPVMGPEVHNDEMIGLCMGYFLSPKNSELFRLILNEYKDYDYPINKEDWIYPWGEFAVIRPLRIYKDNPNLVHLLSSDKLEPIYLNYVDREELFHLNRWDKVKDAYQLHLWENINKPTLKYLTPKSILENDSTYSLAVRNWLPKEINFNVHG